MNLIECLKLHGIKIPRYDRGRITREANRIAEEQGISKEHATINVLDREIGELDAEHSNVVEHIKERRGTGDAARAGEEVTEAREEERVEGEEPGPVRVLDVEKDRVDAEPPKEEVKEEAAPVEEVFRTKGEAELAGAIDELRAKEPEVPIYKSKKAAEAAGLEVHPRGSKPGERMTYADAKAFAGKVDPELDAQVIKMGKNYRVAVEAYPEDLPVEDVGKAVEGYYAEEAKGPEFEMDVMDRVEAIMDEVMELDPKTETAKLKKGIDAEAKLDELAGLTASIDPYSRTAEVVDKLSELLRGVEKKPQKLEPREKPDFTKMPEADWDAGVDIRNIITDERGMVDLSGLSEESSELIRRIAKEAKTAGISTKDYLIKGGYDSATARKIDRAVGQMYPEGLEKGDLSVSNKEAEVKTDVTTAEIDENIDAIKYSDPSGFAKWMESAGRMVPRWKKGDPMPRWMTPLIDEKSIPFIEPEGKLWRVGESPGNVLGRVFSLDNHPVIDAMEGHMSMATNVFNQRRWKKSLLKSVKETDVEISEALNPVYEKYKDVLNKRSEVYRRINLKTEKVRRIAKGPRKEQLKKELKNLRGDIKAANKKLKPMMMDYDVAVYDLAKNNADVRIALNAGDSLPKGIEMSAEEIRISEQIRNYMEAAREHLDAVGIPTIKDRAYMTRLWSKLMEDPKDAQFAERFFKRFKKTPTVMKFMSQLPEGRIWYPSAHGIMDAYIPLLNRKLAYQPFLNRWSEFIEVDAPPKVRNYMRDWMDANLYKRSEHILEKGVNAAVSFEYARLIGLSLSVGFKHLLKLPATMARYDAITNVKAMVKTFKIPGQVLKEKMGGVPKGRELDVLRSYLFGRDIVRAMDEIPSMKETTSRFKQLIAQPTVAIEAFDNGVSILAGVISGAEKGLDVRTVQRAIWRTVLDTNFRGQWDQMLWQKRWYARAATMFQLTPFKLAEYKWQMIERAAKGQRDAFGTHYGTMLTRYIVAVGLAETIARANDTSILELFLHPPFVRHLMHASKDFPGYKLTEPELAISPTDQWHARAADKGLIRGTADHFKYWGTLSKFKRASEANYPTGYYDSPWRQVFGLPRIDPTKGRKGGGSGRTRGGRSRSRSR